MRHALFALLLALIWAHAQSPVTAATPQAAEAMVRAERAMQQALASYEHHYPDRPLWRDAIREARTAARLEPETPSTTRLLAEVLSRANWYGPALEAWEDYLAAGGVLTSTDAGLYADAGHEMGYGAYRQGDLPLALRYYERVAEVARDPEALVWAGRILLELGEPQAAIPYWERALAQGADEGQAEYFLTLARTRSEHGAAAADAFFEGVALYEAGQTQDAAQRFVAAARANEAFTQAFVWAGRTLLESSQPERALPYWQAVAERDPEDERASYFLALTRDQLEWGPEAADAFRAGVAAYESGDMQEAARQFAAATVARDRYAEAWAWRGRVAFERGAFAEAGTYYERASALEPDNDAYRYFYQEAQRRAG